ncbi:hypothetical protein [Methanolapillus ohkumae]|uniref:hypothetical protein n=1 Tax=Methanolapillus ohkumae TaxID=3028298 RepID=UPI0030B88796
MKELLVGKTAADYEIEKQNVAILKQKTERSHTKTKNRMTPYSKLEKNPKI